MQASSASPWMPPPCVLRDACSSPNSASGFPQAGTISCGLFPLLLPLLASLMVSDSGCPSPAATVPSKTASH